MVCLPASHLPPQAPSSSHQPLLLPPTISFLLLGFLAAFGTADQSSSEVTLSQGLPSTTPHPDLPLAPVTSPCGSPLQPPGSSLPSTAPQTALCSPHKRHSACPAPSSSSPVEHTIWILPGTHSLPSCPSRPAWCFPFSCSIWFEPFDVK